MILNDTGYEFGSLKKTRAAVIAGSKGCFLPGLSDWLNVRLEECIFAGPPVQSFRKTVIQYIIVRKKSKSLKISKFKIWKNESWKYQSRQNFNYKILSRVYVKQKISSRFKQNVLEILLIRDVKIFRLFLGKCTLITCCSV